MIHTDALFSDETVDYKWPDQPRPGDEVTLCLRTFRDDELYATAHVDGEEYPMSYARSEGCFNYFTAVISCGRRPVHYYFSVSSYGETLYYSRLGCSGEPQEWGSFSFIPGLYVPEWAMGTVYYQIFIDRFRNGERSNSVSDGEYYYHGLTHRVEDWDRPPAQMDVNNFYGGDLQGVWEKLDYLQALGVETIYFNPLFISPSNHKYDTQDYDHIDPHLAVVVDDCWDSLDERTHYNIHARRYIKRVTSRANLEASDAYFAEFVWELHRRGMRIVIDGVFNHCGSFHKWMDREGIYRGADDFAPGAYQSVRSPYRRYFRFFSNDRAHAGYEGWWNFETLPKLNYEGSQELIEEVLEIGEKWVSPPYNVDGWRLDVAADLGHSPRFNHIFWNNFHKRVRRANPEAVILAEHYGDPGPWLEGGEWDSVMNYDAFMEPVTWFLTGMEKHSDSFDAQRLNNGTLFFQSMAENMNRLPRPALDAALNQLSNHDHSRFLTRTNRTVGRLDSKGSAAAGEGTDRRVMILAVLIQMTWPGSPGVYYGDEAGQVGWTDPDSRRTYPWEREDQTLLNFHRSAIALRGSMHCLRRGSLLPLCAGDGLIASGRFDRRDCAVVLVNNNDWDLTIDAPVWRLGVPWNETGMELALAASEEAERLEAWVNVWEGTLSVCVPQKSGCVYRFRFQSEEDG